MRYLYYTAKIENENRRSKQISEEYAHGRKINQFPARPVPQPLRFLCGADGNHVPGSEISCGAGPFPRAVPGVCDPGERGAADRRRRPDGAGGRRVPAAHGGKPPVSGRPGGALGENMDEPAWQPVRPAAGRLRAGANPPGAGLPPAAPVPPVCRNLRRPARQPLSAGKPLRPAVP